MESGEASNDSSESFELIRMDVCEDDSVQESIEYILEKEGRLDVVVNNAASSILGALEDVSIEESKQVFEANLFGILRVCQAVIPVMREQRSGYIINVSSLGGLFAMPYDGIYCASKHAVEGLTETLRMELKQFGINTVLIEPGDIDTGMTARMPTAEKARTNPVYLESFKKVNAAAIKNEDDSVPPAVVALLLERIINTPAPKLRYKVGLMMQKAVVPLKRLLPETTFEWLIMKNYEML